MSESIKRYKFPRIPHLPWSPGATRDDRVLQDTSCFEREQVVVTVKYDGENTTMYPDGYVHARSVDSRSHASRSVVKRLAAEIPWWKLGDEFINPNAVRLCGENVYARHSIAYNNLPHYFIVFGIHYGDLCLSYEYTRYLAEENLGLATARVLYQGVWDEDKIQQLYTPEVDGDPCEGYVVRLAHQFNTTKATGMAKYVREDHVQTDEHWMSRPIVVNGLRGQNE